MATTQSQNAATPSKEPSGSAPQSKWKLIAMVVALVALVVLAERLSLGDRLGQLKEWIASLGAWGPVAFILIYTIATVAMAPGVALTVAAGAIFGSVLGVVIVSAASTLGATLCFLIARFYGRGLIREWVARNEKFAKLDEMSGRYGGWIVAITRLVPLFPFNMLNYGLGFTKVRFLTYVFLSWLCMLPGTALYVVGADALFKALKEGEVPWALVGVIVVVFGFITWMGFVVKKKLAKSETEASPGVVGEEM